MIIMLDVAWQKKLWIYFAAVRLQRLQTESSGVRQQEKKALNLGRWGCWTLLEHGSKDFDAKNNRRNTRPWRVLGKGMTDLICGFFSYQQRNSGPILKIADILLLRNTLPRKRPHVIETFCGVRRPCLCLFCVYPDSTLSWRTTQKKDEYALK